MDRQAIRRGIFVRWDHAVVQDDTLGARRFVSGVVHYILMQRRFLGQP